MAEAKRKYFHCHAEGHWRRNYPKYLKSLKTKKDDKPSEGMLIIESNLMISSTSSWILDSSSSAHICTSMQGLRKSKRLRKGDMIFLVDNGVKITAEAVGTYPLQLSLEFRLELKDYYFISIASQNLIFIFVLAQDGFDFNFNKIFILFIYEIN